MFGNGRRDRQTNFQPNITTLRSAYGMSCLSFCLSVICNVRAPCSEGWSFRKYFWTT